MNRVPTGVVITSIAPPNAILREIADGCLRAGYRFWVIGDVASPAAFSLPGCEYLSVERQLETGLRFAMLCPVRRYARKNIGYLLAMRAGVQVLLESDDDNIPREEFWRARHAGHHGPAVTNGGWVNVYRYFTSSQMWPRGFPLDAVAAPPPDRALLRDARVHCPIQQGLADLDPDVDAVYRLLFPLPVSFDRGRPIILTRGSWCPFNSQNTAWFRDAFPLLYLPAHCSFRMSDIWRSFIAQRICWENGWGILFSEADVYQERNPHDPMRDFKDELPGYLENRRIARVLEKTPLTSGVDALAGNLVRCYEALTGEGIIPRDEMALLEAWIEDVESMPFAAAAGAIKKG